MKVLIVNRFMGLYGGAEQVVKELSLNLTRLGVENTVLTLNLSKEVADKCKGINIVTPETKFKYEFRSRSFLSSLGIFKEIYYLRKLIKRYCKDFDVINLHNFPASWVGLGIDKPTVWLCNEIPDFYNNKKLSLPLKLVRWFGVKLDKTIINSSVDVICAADRFNAETVKQRYGKTAILTPYGIDKPPADFGKASKKEVLSKYGLSDDSFVLLQVGVISPAKNQEDTIQAFSKITDKIPSAKLILAGNDSGAYAASLKKEVSELSLPGKVIFTGMLNKEDVYDLYSACNLCVFPVKLQGGYLSVFEALSCAVPVVVYPQMGAATLVQDNNLGTVTQDLASALINIHNSYQKYKEQASKASVWVKENLTWDKFSRQYIDIFQQATKEGK
ncbi:MAG: glycosyltransferase family 4 protein [Candidatus Omnitrophota bacterium]